MENKITNSYMKQKILLTLLATISLNATTITGIGYADLGQEAKKEALSDLSNKISVTVKSDFTTITKSLGDEYSKSNEKFLQLSSNLPILGVSFEELIGNILVKSTATLDAKTALSLYVMELERLYKNISQSMLDLETTADDTVRYTLLNQTLNDIENFNKHKIVATLLKAKDLPTLQTTKSEIQAQLLQAVQNVSSLAIAGKILSENITQKDIYISAIRPSGSSDITQFAKLLKSEMNTQLHTVKQSSNAKYFLRGEYEILSDKIFVTTTLSDSENKIIQTNTVSLQPSAYQNTHYKSTTKTFDTAMNSEFIKSGGLNVQVGFRGYNRANGIDFYDGDTVDIIVKTNKSICYFLIGHTLKENDTFSYLLPIGSEESPFIANITGEDVNKNITIIDGVPIQAPFGSENLQILSSTFQKDGSCPLRVPYTHENYQGYFEIDGKPSEVVGKTRALNVNKRKFTIEQSEANVSFTSFEK